jgi:hypothetical protein
MNAYYWNRSSVVQLLWSSLDTIDAPCIDFHPEDTLLRVAKVSVATRYVEGAERRVAILNVVAISRFR